MELEQVLAGRNVEGEIYSCDVGRWLTPKEPYSMSYKDRDTIKVKLEELRRVTNVETVKGR